MQDGKAVIYVMAMPKKGSRSLIVDNQKYRWSVRRTEDDTNWNDYGMATTLTIAVENYDNPKNMLCITYRCGSEAWHGAPELPTVALLTGQEMKITPGQVADLVRIALKQGWNPEAKAGKFCVTL